MLVIGGGLGIICHVVAVELTQVAVDIRSWEVILSPSEAWEVTAACFLGAAFLGMLFVLLESGYCAVKKVLKK